MSWKTSVAIIATSSFLALALAEGSLRVLKIGVLYYRLQPSSVYHHAHTPSYEVLVTDPNEEYGGHYVIYDINGHRTGTRHRMNIFNDDNSEAIVFLGDSFTEGHQVSYHKSFVGLLGERLNRATLNLGVSSYSPIIYLVQVKNIVKHLQASTVILQVYYNDFNSDRNLGKQAVNQNGVVIAIDGERNKLITLVRKLYLARLFSKARAIVLEKWRNTPKSMASELHNEPLFAQEQNVTIEDIKYTSGIIDEIRNELQKAQKDLFIFLIPSRALLKNLCAVRPIKYITNLKMK